MANRAALYFGLAPLLAGLGVYALWLMTRWDGLVAVGVYVMAGGAACLALGATALFIDLSEARGGGASFRAVVRRGWLPAVLLAVNVPVGLGVAALAVLQLTAFTVTLHNESPETISQFALDGPGVAESWDSVGPGETRSATVHFSNDGLLRYDAAVGREAHSGTLVGYVTSGMGGSLDVRYRRDGAFGWADPASDV